MAALCAASNFVSGLAGSALPIAGQTGSSRRPSSILKIVASGGKKTITKTPLGPSGDFKSKLDASGRKSTGKGVYQFVKKYGANVDGYSPIFDRGIWSANGDTYEAGAQGLTLWAVTFGALLAVGAFLVYTTSGLS